MIDLEPTPKKAKPSASTSNLKRKLEGGASPNKRQRLEDDGVILLDGPDEVLEPLPSKTQDADYIIIDD